jgi:ABC-type phosphate transport system substrate-binding protein
LTDWSQLYGGRSGSLTVVYPQGVSGTTELFTRFLNAKCNPVVEGGTFAITKVFSQSFSRGLPATAINPRQQPIKDTIPPYWETFKDTSEGVMSTLNYAEGRITFIGAGYAATTLSGLDDASKVARVNGVSPAPVNIAAALAAIPVPALAIRANPNAWVPVFGPLNPNDPSVFAYPSTGYSILGFSTVIFSQCYADAAQAAQVRAFLARHYGAIVNNDAAITANRFVPLPAAWKTALRSTFLTATSGLSIGNPSVCNGIGRPL